MQAFWNLPELAALSILPRVARVFALVNVQLTGPELAVNDVLYLPHVPLWLPSGLLLPGVVGVVAVEQEGASARFLLDAFARLRACTQPMQLAATGKELQGQLAGLDGDSQTKIRKALFQVYEAVAREVWRCTGRP